MKGELTRWCSGPSMGGLLAARALTGFYHQASIVDRDTLPPPGEQRRGVPQGRHAHTRLFARGRESLEELFPGLTDDLVAQGALRGDLQTAPAARRSRQLSDRRPQPGPAASPDPGLGCPCRPGLPSRRAGTQPATPSAARSGRLHAGLVLCHAHGNGFGG